MEDVFEELVRWYLRFNGYLCVENFVVHEPDLSAQTVPQGAEIDTLAVRFPFSNEVIAATPQKHVLHDPRLECPSPRHIDCIIAEIKGGERIRLNSIWREQTEQARRRVQYIVRWLGCIEDEQRLTQISADLQTNLHAEEGPYFFRVILFARRSAPQNLPPGITVITFEDIARFFVTSRANCWQELGIGTRSRHPQWSDLINELWSLAGPENPADADCKVHQMLACLDRMHARRQVETSMANAVRKLTHSELYPFDENLRAALPTEHGLYIIYDCAANGEISPIRAGRTKSATGGLRQRVYANHFMGDQNGNLRQQLISDGVCADLESAQAWVKSRCRVRFLAVADGADRRWLEHYMLSVIRPRYSD